MHFYFLPYLIVLQQDDKAFYGLQICVQSCRHVVPVDPDNNLVYTHVKYSAILYFINTMFNFMKGPQENWLGSYLTTTTTS